MKYILLCVFSIICFNSINPIYAQKRKKRIKPLYYGKLQGGYLIEKFIPKGYNGFNYFNFGIRKKTGEKIKEWGLESFYYQEENKTRFLSRSLVTGYRQTGFGINYYQYFLVKQWRFGKLNIQTGPQFSFGYFHNKKVPFLHNNFPITINDFKLGGAARIELNYKIDERYAAIIGTHYTAFQFGLRRENTQNPILVRREQLEDFLQFDFFLPRLTAYFGVLFQFGKVKINRAKLKKKREKERQRKKEKVAKKRAKQIEKRKKQTEKKKKKRLKKNKNKKTK